MKKDEETKQRILNAGRVVFRQYGPVKATMMDVARAAGVSKSLVYYYFKDKNELFRQVVIAMDRQFLDDLRRRVMHEKTARHRLRVLLIERFARLTQAAARRRVSLERSLEFYPLFHSLVALFWDEETGMVREIIDFGVENGEFCVEDPRKWSRQVAMVLLAMDHQLFMNAVDGVVDLDAWGMVVDTLIRGLQCQN